MSKSNSGLVGNRAKMVHSDLKAIVGAHTTVRDGGVFEVLLDFEINIFIFLVFWMQELLHIPIMVKIRIFAISRISQQISKF